MRFRNSAPAGQWVRLITAMSACLLPPFFLCSCASRTDPAPFRASESTVGTVRWQQADHVVNYHAVLARDSHGNVKVELRKGLPQPWLTIHLPGQGEAEVEINPPPRKWRGARENAPLALRPILALAALYASEAALPNGAREIHSDGLRTAVQVRRHQLTSASVLSEDLPLTISFTRREAQ